jgi:hypothetical protein
MLEGKGVLMSVSDEPDISRSLTLSPQRAPKRKLAALVFVRAMEKRSAGFDPSP